MSAARPRKGYVHTMRDGWCTICGEHLEWIVEHDERHEDAAPTE